ncbi:MAG: universal stress protein [Bacteroidota bacterium]
MLGFGRAPQQLVELAKKANINLLVMGGHRHQGLKDIFFGASITRVRHQLPIPVLIV